MFGSHGKWWILLNITAIAYISGLHPELLFPDPPVHLLYIEPMIGATQTTQAWYDLFRHKLDDFMPSSFWLVQYYLVNPRGKTFSSASQTCKTFAMKKCPIHVHMHKKLPRLLAIPDWPDCVLALPPSTCWCSIATAGFPVQIPNSKTDEFLRLSSEHLKSGWRNLCFCSEIYIICIYIYTYLAWQSILASKVILSHLKTVLNHTNDW